MQETSQIITCDCGHPATPDGIAAGYARDRNDRTMCYMCAAAAEYKDALESGRAVFYLSHDYTTNRLRNTRGYISPNGATVGNWTGFMKFSVKYMRVGWHNMADYRIDVWFRDIYGNWWWGRQYGNFSQLCYCRRIKKLWT